MASWLPSSMTAMPRLPHAGQVQVLWPCRPGSHRAQGPKGLEEQDKVTALHLVLLQAVLLPAAELHQPLARTGHASVFAPES